MAVTIIATVAGSTSNCYITAADADAYFADTLQEDEWQGYAVDDRARALIQATRQIEGLRLAGEPEDEDQALHFPRVGDLDDDNSYYIIPAVENACCEQALYLLDVRANPDLLDRERLQGQGVVSVSLDGVSETYRANADGLGPRARRLLGKLIRRTISVQRADYDETDSDDVEWVS